MWVTEHVQGDGGPPGSEGPGAIAEEALRLVSSVQDWARRTFPESEVGHGSDCRWCPLCQFVAALRGEHPEVTDRVAEAGTAVASALRALVDAASGAAAGQSGQSGQRRHSGPPDGPRVQRIDLDPES
jgi:hypothetical protein